MSEKPWRDRTACRTACMTSKKWAGTNKRLRQAMVDGAMQRLEEIEANPHLYVGYCAGLSEGVDSVTPAAWRWQAYEGAQNKAKSCGFSFIWISIALKLFEWFILPKILEWWRSR